MYRLDPLQPATVYCLQSRCAFETTALDGRAGALAYSSWSSLAVVVTDNVCACKIWGTLSIKPPPQWGPSFHLLALHTIVRIPRLGPTLFALVDANHIHLTSHLLSHRRCALHLAHPIPRYSPPRYRVCVTQVPVPGMPLFMDNVVARLGTLTVDLAGVKLKWHHGCSPTTSKSDDTLALPTKSGAALVAECHFSCAPAGLPTQATVAAGRCCPGSRRGASSFALTPAELAMQVVELVQLLGLGKLVQLLELVELVQLLSRP